MSTKKADDLEALDEQRHKRSENAAGADRWLISYADFMTLLLAFFIVMFAISQVNKAKVEGFEQSMQVAFGGKRPVTETAPPKANAPFHHLPSPVPLIAVPPAVAQAIRKQELAMMRMRDKLEKVLQPLINTHEVSIAHTPTGTRIRINASVLFANGSAQLQPEALQIVDAVGLVLKPLHYRIFVIGYTNNQPIRSAKYPSNWYLSSDRALSVLNRFLHDGVNPSLLSAVGRGKYHPAVPYTQKTMQQALAGNRRVTIVVQGNTRIIMREMTRTAEQGPTDTPNAIIN
ncbi:MAG: flagellar motor protein MotB [Acidithiobacillus ferriphilus]|uniref:flagellar motor protein MotB n=1 Tax=Acidithiobacillus ferriphilus TaxID=1689834 RepID=UPI001C070040|nr:flagellar motor protein MotB [Acidithiobacillus ferriphilus]MBU2849389.1 OmpA family protein [Acidithiobacillus ferriphilus]MEB8476270.1 OmpA family protein [Acidithiobacillus ferriphilus]